MSEEQKQPEAQRVKDLPENVQSDSQPYFVWVCQECRGLIEGEWRSAKFIQDCQCNPETRIKVKHYQLKAPPLQVGHVGYDIGSNKIPLKLKYTFKDGNTAQQTLYFEGTLPEDDGDDMFVAELRESCPEDVRGDLLSIKAEFVLKPGQEFAYPEWWTSANGKWFFK
jgi:hypothetical protein